MSTQPSHNATADHAGLCGLEYRLESHSDHMGERRMIGKVVLKSHIPFELDGTQPKRLCVRCASPPDHATPMYAVVADYGWAERILCSDAYLRDANDIAETIAEALLCPVELARAAT